VIACRRPKKIEIREDTRTGEVFLAGSDSLYTLVESMKHAREIIQAGVRLPALPSRAGVSSHTH
jgi:hypothetical protein